MFAGEDLYNEVNEVQRTLLTLANSGKPRSDFLYSVTQEVLRLTNGHSLDLWFEEGDQICHWSQRSGEPIKLELVYEKPAEDLWAHSLATMENGSTGKAVMKSRAVGGETGKEARLVMASDDSSSSTIILSFDIDEDHCGVLELIMPGKLNDAMTAVCERLAKTIGVVMAIYLSKAALAERVKELACMYSIAQVAANSELSLENSIQKVVELLPKAWQYTRIASSRISLDGRLFFSEGFCEGPQTMSAEILVGGTPRGNVEIFYSKQDQQFEDFSLVVAQPFLQEEHHLIEGVAREVAFLVERTNAEAERTALQEQVRHADRLVTIGQLAAGVAHELNEPLGSVLGFAQLLAKKPGLDDQTSRDIEKITAAALFAREIVKKLMFFARQAPTRISLVNLNQTVQSATDLLEMRCSKARIRMKRNLCSEIPDIKGDPAQLQQVIVNLVVNAIQATPEGGEIEIATGIRKNEVLLTVDDSGDGISHEHVDKVFLPFFTTKDVGQGTGLGLAVVHGIVSAHGGTVEVVPKGDKGARLRVLLPARDCKIGTQ